MRRQGRLLCGGSGLAGCFFLGGGNAVGEVVLPHHRFQPALRGRDLQGFIEYALVRDFQVDECGGRIHAQADGGK